MKKITLLVFGLISFQSFSQFTESFEAGIPADWTIINGGDFSGWNANVPVPPVTPHSGINVARLFYSAEAHNDYLITKPFTVSATSNRISFWYRHQQDIYPEPFSVMISTTGTAEADFVNLLPDEILPNETWQNRGLSLNDYVGQTIYIAFRSTTTEQYNLYLDDITVDAQPLTAPLCASNLVATPNESCGNLATTLSWDIDATATGYYLTVGTTSGGTDIINNLDIVYVDHYEVTNQAIGTNYFWKITPYNAFGQATTCEINSYTTATSPCYCSPLPFAVDDHGITNFSMGAIDNATYDVHLYDDFTSLVTDAAQGSTQAFSIEMQTGYVYKMNIWIDWNNDYDFDDAEETAFTGLCTAAVPNYVNGSFTVPVTASVGSHRMRVGGQDTPEASPCYVGSLFATFEDYTINVTPRLGNGSFENATFSYYPNPVVAILTLQSDVKISNIEVYNLLGQIVSTKSIEDNKVDLSELSSGSYLVQFTADAKTHRVSVLKQ
jgi:hypothetical protein